METTTSAFFWTPIAGLLVARGIGVAPTIGLVAVAAIGGGALESAALAFAKRSAGSHPARRAAQSEGMSRCFMVGMVGEGSVRWHDPESALTDRLHGWPVDGWIFNVFRPWGGPNLHWTTVAGGRLWSLDLRSVSDDAPENVPPKYAIYRASWAYGQPDHR